MGNLTIDLLAAEAWPLALRDDLKAIREKLRTGRAGASDAYREMSLTVDRYFERHGKLAASVAEHVRRTDPPNAHRLELRDRLQSIRQSLTSAAGEI